MEQLETVGWWQQLFGKAAERGVVASGKGWSGCKIVQLEAGLEESVNRLRCLLQC